MGIGIGAAVSRSEQEARREARIAAAEARDVLLVAGPTFSAHGGFADFVRLPFGYPLDQVDVALERLAAAWSDVERHRPAPMPSRRITIA